MCMGSISPRKYAHAHIGNTRTPHIRNFACPHIRNVPENGHVLRYENGCKMNERYDLRRYNHFPWANRLHRYNHFSGPVVARTRFLDYEVA